MGHKILTIWVILSLCGIAFADDVHWTGAVSRSWSDDGNWDLGHYPGLYDKGVINSAPGPLIDSSSSVFGGAVSIGGAMDVTGGSFYAWNGSIYVGEDALTNGTLNVSGGAITVDNGNLNIGQNGTGNLYVSGGTISQITSGQFTIGNGSAGAVGHVYLTGGTINCLDFAMASSGGTATMDLTVGRVVISGDKRAIVNTYINNGWITAYGGSGTVSVDFGITNSGKTTLIGDNTPNAKAPSPAHNATNVMPYTILSWVRGYGAVSHNVYFGTTSPGTFRGNQTATTFDPGKLAIAKTYYWRVDEVNSIGGITTGNVWTFSTVPGIAKNPDPANSATNLAYNKILSWAPGVGAASHDVYFGTVLSDVNSVTRLLGDLNGDNIVNWKDISLLSQHWLLNPAGTEPFAACNDDSVVDFIDYAQLATDWRQNAGTAFKGNQDANSFDPGLLPFSTTYYWRVDEVNGPDTYRGSIWSFTTQSGKATNPNPGTGWGNIQRDPNLTWTAGPGATSHNVYFGTANPPAFIGNQTSTSYIPGTLNNTTTYYWRIDEVSPLGTTQGDVWNFVVTGVANNTTITNKILCGYQGWFNAPNDGTPLGWVHWGASGFGPYNCTVDMWPDVTELTAGEKSLASSFADANGNHYVFSSHNSTTVNRHFQWMQNYGIDGIFLQRFGTEVTYGSATFTHRNDVLSYCKDGANTYGRVYAVMYDLTDLGANTVVTKIETDWKWLIDNGKVIRDGSDPAYMRHNNKPVVAVWGIGWTDTHHPYSKAECLTLVNFLKDDPTYGGNTVVIGIPNKWRTSGFDSTMQTICTTADVLSPWTVGSYGTDLTSQTTRWSADKTWCQTNSTPSHPIDYLPVIWPGYSFYNKSVHAQVLNQYPRFGGQFFWSQVYATVSTVGTNMVYVAMFDEVDEGTAIFKVTNNPPVTAADAAKFVVYRQDVVIPGTDPVRYSATGAPLASDEYLWLTGQAGRALRGEISPVPSTRPAR